MTSQIIYTLMSEFQNKQYVMQQWRTTRQLQKRLLKKYIKSKDNYYAPIPLTLAVAIIQLTLDDYRLPRVDDDLLPYKAFLDFLSSLCR
jgi:hypothetical protein